MQSPDPTNIYVQCYLGDEELYNGLNKGCLVRRKDLRQISFLQYCVLLKKTPPLNLTAGLIYLLETLPENL